MDISKLSQQDISQLREVLGIIPQVEQPQYAEEEDIHSVFGDSLENLPSLRVEFDPANLSDGEHPQNSRSEKNRQISSELRDALFDNDESVIVEE